MVYIKFVTASVLLTSLVSATFIPLDKRATLEEFIATERAASIQGVLANIGPDGALAENATRGVVIAGPGVVNPDYRYSWTRDSALTLAMVDEEFFLGDASLQVTIEDYIYAEANRQTVVNAMGGLYPWGTGMGEPKYQINLTRFDGLWGRPQRDGPALRAITLMMYVNYLILHGQTDRARTVVWPVIRNDLAYVGEYWATRGYDLWEEVAGFSFFTIASQYRALVQGSHIAHRLGVTCDACISQAPQVACFLRNNNFWDATGGYIIADISGGAWRSGINADPILGAMTLFDIRAPCNPLGYQPCSSRILSTHKVYVDSFREIYPINAGIAANAAVATGRYPEDSYYGGNPWYITTLASAEVLYDAAAQFRRQGKINIDSVSLAFFQQFYPAAKIATYTAPASAVSASFGDSTFGQKTYGSPSKFTTKATSEFTDILTALTNYADGFVAVVQQYTPSNGSLSEQFNRTSGEPLSAYALTWSFASFVTMAQRRAGQYPPSWNSQANPGIASTCSASPVQGTYAPAIAAGAPAVDMACTVQVTFHCDVGDTGAGLYIMGNDSLLGDWHPNHTPMVPVDITDDAHVWYTVADLAPETTFSYAYVIQNANNYTVECQNRTVTTPACGDGRVQISTNDDLGATCAVITENFCNPDVEHCW